MAAREEVKEDFYRCHGLSDNGLDAVPYHGNQDNSAEDLGSIQYSGYLYGM